MLNSIFKNLHLIIIVYALYTLGDLGYEYFEKINKIKLDVKNSTEHLGKLKKEKKTIDNFLKDIDDAKGRVEKVASEIVKMQELLPTQISDTENISLLRKMSDDLNIKEVSITPQKDEKRDFVIVRGYNLKARATYLQFLVMFEKIADNQRILNVNSINFKKLDQPQRSKFQLIDGEFVLEAFMSNSEFKQNSSIDKIDQVFKSLPSNGQQNTNDQAVKPNTKI